MLLPSPSSSSELAQVLAQGRTDLTGTVRKHHRIAVKVEDLFSQQLQGLVEAEPRKTGGEAGHEDVQVGRQGLAVVLFDVLDFHAVPDVPDIILVAVQELVEGLRINEFSDLHLVVALAKFAPHGVRHHLGQGALSGIAIDVVVIQVDAFPSRIVVDVAWLSWVVHPAGHPLASSLILSQVFTYSAKRPWRLWGKCHTSWIFTTT